MEREWKEKFGYLHYFDEITGSVFRIESGLTSDGRGQADLCLFTGHGWVGVFRSVENITGEAVAMCQEYMDFLFPVTDYDISEDSDLIPGFVSEL